jgi:polyisoprenyl-teichoic acid--peptidoglycan teichoic acid transferase
MTKVYKLERRGSLSRGLVLVPFALLVLLILYLFLPLGSQRVVLLGSDARADEASRSDTIVIGGPELAVDTLENFTGLPIENYVVLNFGGVEEIVDALGGITLNVEETMETEQDDEYFFISAGVQELTGDEALAYVRYRGGPTADIGRVGRQLRFLGALGREISSPEKLPRLPATLRAVRRNVETNMNPLGAVRFIVRASLLGGGGAEIYPGSPQYIGGISYWVPDTVAGQRVVEATVG